jgi:hypothetical protein
VKRCVSLLALLAAYGCATTKQQACLVEDAGQARLIGLAVLRAEDGPNFHVEDRGERWVVGAWVEDLQTDDEVLLGFGGRSIEIEKCTGRLSNLRSWR